MRVHRHLDKVPAELMEGGREALAWIYRVATNYCLNEVRDRQRRPEPVETLPEAAGADPHSRLLDADLARRLLARAPEKLRAPTWLHHVDGLDQGAVAEVLGISRGTVIRRLAAFEENARKFMARAEGDER